MKRRSLLLTVMLLVLVLPVLASAKGPWPAGVTKFPTADGRQCVVGWTNPEGDILPDMFTRVDIVKQDIPDALVAPLYTVITRNDKTLVYVVSDGKAMKREVTLGIQEGWRVQIKSGLFPEDLLIVMGHRSVAENQPVQVVRAVDFPEDIAK